jgi:hypothetical protein
MWILRGLDVAAADRFLLPREALLSSKKCGLQDADAAPEYGASVEMLNCRTAMTGVKVALRLATRIVLRELREPSTRRLIPQKASYPRNRLVQIRPALDRSPATGARIAHGHLVTLARFPRPINSRRPFPHRSRVERRRSEAGRRREVDFAFPANRLPK